MYASFLDCDENKRSLTATGASVVNDRAEAGSSCYPQFENDPNLRNLKGDAAYSALMGKLKQQWLYYKATL
jgi:hypothetical protein